MRSRNYGDTSFNWLPLPHALASAARCLRQAESMWRPLGAADFLARLEAESGRVLAAGTEGGGSGELSGVSP